MLLSRRLYLSRRLASLFLALAVFGVPCAHVRADDVEFFEKKIRPLLVDHCYACHSAAAGKSKGSLLLDSKANLLKGGENGPVIFPKEPEKSRLIEAVRYTNPDLQMPPKGKRLTEQQVADLVEWVRLGAPDPRVASATDPLAGSYDYAAARSLWAFMPPKEQAVPEVVHKQWVKSPIDCFVLAKLEAKGLLPAPALERRALIRRATYDLTGLPPTVQEVEAFVADESADAFSKVVDRLLASPAYGECWARHWLDVVRYADSFDSRAVSNASLGDITAAWRYRDWVVKAFNQDLPYNEFVADQIAGDLLPKKGPDDFDGLIATGLYVIGNWPGGDADRKKMLTDIVDDQVDVTGRAFMGLTLACARCHDHKFDPIPTADYYSLAGIFFSSHFLPDPGSPTSGGPVLRIPLLNADEQEKKKQREAQLAELQRQADQQLKDEFAKLVQMNLSQCDQYLAAAWELSHGKSGTKPEALASERHLNSRLLARWIAYLKPATQVNPPQTRTPLTVAVHKVEGIDGVEALRGPSNQPCPCITFNFLPREVAYKTITLPGRSICVHPGPASGIAIGWKSPIAGVVQIEGRVIDADAHCGNGIAWRTSLLADAACHDLAGGAFNNGGAQDFAQGEGGGALQSVEVHAGQTIQLAVYPKGDYSCDSTTVELKIKQRDGDHHVWQLTSDLLASPLEDAKANPHADSLGNPAVWSYYEVPDVSSVGLLAGSGALSSFIRSVSANDDKPEDVLQAAAQLREKVIAARERSVSMGKPPAASDGPETKLLIDLSDAASTFWGNRDENDLSAEARDSLKSIRRQIEQVKKQASDVPYCHALQEGGCPNSMYEGIHDARIHVRGRYDRQTTQVPRRFPRLLAGDQQAPITRGSGRLDLAEWITRPEHPLTARVMVNRIWQHHFGEGIVRTPNNFGKLGTPPTHPELLDYLAVQFVRNGWSIKAIQRQIMLSAAYQQSSEPDPKTYKADPDNLLFGHVNRRRLEAEELRDALLADSDTLDRTLGGPSIRSLDNPRRTLYLMTIRSERADYRSLFDAADPTGISEKRIDSTVAPQALFLLNNSFALKKTVEVAALVLKQPNADDRARIDWLYGRLFSRNARPEEIEIGLQLLEKSRKEVIASAGAGKEETAWTEYCQVLLCSNEFVYID